MDSNDSQEAPTRDMGAVSDARWRKRKWRTKKARTEFSRYIASHKTTFAGGRPRSTDRCPCGAMTSARAAQRNHRCEALRITGVKKH
jgi:hypothetical protein